MQSVDKKLVHNCSAVVAFTSCIVSPLATESHTLSTQLSQTYQQRYPQARASSTEGIFVFKEPQLKNKLYSGLLTREPKHWSNTLDANSANA